ncbi:hypothetical protein [Micromonospora sp. NPDC050495]
MLRPWLQSKGGDQGGCRFGGAGRKRQVNGVRAKIAAKACPDRW